MKAHGTKKLANTRNGERGAALVITILLSTLLLAAGGTLILTTALTGTNAIDSTAEMQAYYAAEAGVSQALSVLRGNVESNPSGTRATFRNVVSSPNLWTATAGNLVVIPGTATAFQITSVIDPDDPDGSIRAADDTYQPAHLRIQVTGSGPKNSEKHMEVVVRRLAFDFPVNSTITLPNQSLNPLTINLGNSNVTSYSGTDAAGNPLPTIPAFGVSTQDYNSTNNVMDGCAPDGTSCNGSGPNVDPEDPLVLTDPSTPDFLKSVTNARLLLDGPNGLKATAINQGRYFSTGEEAISSSGGLGGSNPNGILTFVDGDLILGPGNPTGQGMLVVTGTLTLNGNFNYNGVILVLGGGTVLRTGGGHGNIYGAMFVAKFARTGAETDLFQAPTFDVSGGGTANIQYNSEEIEKAKSSTGHQVLAVREF
jgi:hypothetical protein